MLRDQFAVAKWTHPFGDPVNDVHVQFGCDAAGTCYELIAPFSENSPVWRSLRTGNNITNHMAYIVADLRCAGKAYGSRLQPGQRSQPGRGLRRR